MSPAVLQLFPKPLAHVAGLPTPLHNEVERKNLIQSSKHEIRSWLKKKEQRLPFTDGEENIPPRIQKRPAHGAISGFCRKAGFSLLK